MASDLAMKTIRYRGGVVRFQIPAHWAEEYEPEGGGTFYDPAVEAVTLRLNVLTFQGPRPLRRNEARSALEPGAKPHGAPIEATVDDQALRLDAPKRVEEAGEQRDLHSWSLARVVPPGTTHIAVFSTTVLVEEPPSPTTRATLTMLLDAVRRAVIADVPAQGK